jgi:hypothetical protein
MCAPRLTAHTHLSQQCHADRYQRSAVTAVWWALQEARDAGPAPFRATQGTAPIV